MLSREEMERIESYIGTANAAFEREGCNCDCQCESIREHGHDDEWCDVGDRCLGHCAEPAVHGAGLLLASHRELEAALAAERERRVSAERLMLHTIDRLGECTNYCLACAHRARYKEPLA